MDDFIKTKIGFSVAFLATLFALSPVVNSYGDYSFELLTVEFKIRYLYYSSASFLGFSVYFYSLQFLLNRFVGATQVAGDYCYAIALILPPLYLLLFLFSVIAKLAWDDTYIQIAIMFAGTFVVAFSAAFSGFYLVSRLKQMEVFALRKQLEKQEYESFSRAQYFLEEGNHHLAIIEAFKTVESLLRRILVPSNLRHISTDFSSLVVQASRAGRINKDEENEMRSLFDLRNKVLHDEIDVSLDNAKILIGKVEKFLATFSERGVVGAEATAAHWLMSNRKRALEIIQSPSHKDLNIVMKYLMEAWKKRDGSIAVNISDFFSQSLINNPSALIYEFSKNEDQLKPWLDDIQYFMFTDYGWGVKDELKTLKQSVLDSLEKYIASSANDELQLIAKDIYNTIKDLDIREID